MNRQVRVATIDLALLERRVEGQHPMFAVVDHQDAAEGIPGVMDNIAFAEHAGYGFEALNRRLTRSVGASDNAVSP